jgi:hypothetical protein
VHPDIVEIVANRFSSLPAAGGGYSPSA